MPTKFPSITGDLAAAIKQAAEKICAGRIGFDCQEELTPGKVRVVVAEISPDRLVDFDAVPKHEIKLFVRQNVWWK